MSEPRPFLEDGSQFGISREAFEEMDEDEQRESMLQWFHQNFEDPVNGNALWDGETKEYVYLWGGPYDAQEQLWDKFGDIVSEALIDEVVREIQRDGIVDWAPGSNSPFYEHEEPPEPEEPPSLEIYSDEPSDRYGSPEEREARAHKCRSRCEAPDGAIADGFASRNGATIRPRKAGSRVAQASPLRRLERAKPATARLFPLWEPRF